MISLGGSLLHSLLVSKFYLNSVFITFIALKKVFVVLMLTGDKKLVLAFFEGLRAQSLFGKTSGVVFYFI